MLSCKSSKTIHRCEVKIDPGDTVNSSVHPALSVSSETFAQEVDGVPEPNENLLYGLLKNSESLKNLDFLFVHLPEPKRSELVEFIHKYPCLFGDIPSRTDWIEHNIDVGDSKLIKEQFYRIPPSKHGCRGCLHARK